MERSWPVVCGQEYARSAGLPVGKAQDKREKQVILGQDRAISFEGAIMETNAAGGFFFIRWIAYGQALVQLQSPAIVYISLEDDTIPTHLPW